MRLSELVLPERVIVPLLETTLDGAVGALVERLIATDAVTDPEKLRGRVHEQRGEDIVALGDRAFIMHYRTDAVTHLDLGIGVAPAPVVRELGENEVQRARIVILLLAPPREAARYLQVLGAFARLLSKPSAVEDMLMAPSPAALATLPLLQEFELPEQLLVRDIMTERPRTVTPDTAIRDAARDMVRARIGGLPVVDADGLLLGMLSERELLRHLLSTSQLGGAAHPPPVELTRRTVRDVMTRQVLCVSPDQPLAEAASLMANKDVGRVPVVREGRLVGLLTRGEIVRKLIGY
ncbi:MAG TPA: CBS domain-containing protein [Gemmatimonadaceae bacterium]|nr:CBS domain-containing protein [Gemmatimonadaceae bacterium]